jgi:hypothetical protein
LRPIDCDTACLILDGEFIDYSSSVDRVFTIPTSNTLFLTATRTTPNRFFLCHKNYTKLHDQSKFQQMKRNKGNEID